MATWKTDMKMQKLHTGLRVLQNSVHSTGGMHKWRRIMRNGVLAAGLGPAVSGS